MCSTPECMKICRTKAVLESAKVLSSLTVKGNAIYGAQRISELYDMNLRAFEVSQDSLDLEVVIKESLFKIAKTSVIGVSNVTKADQIHAAHTFGASFVSSFVNPYPAFASDCHRYGLVCIIGALTPEEIQAAYASGADYVQVYPSTLMGIDEFMKLYAQAPPKTLIAADVPSPSISAWLNSGVFLVSTGSSFCGSDISVTKADPMYQFYQREYTQRIRESSATLGTIIYELRLKDKANGGDPYAAEDAKKLSGPKLNVASRTTLSIGTEKSDWSTTSGRDPMLHRDVPEEKVGRAPPGGYSTIHLG